jgi:2-(3-amino-3-carboxypropyl)histidine synthase
MNSAIMEDIESAHLSTSASANAMTADSSSAGTTNTSTRVRSRRTIRSGTSSAVATQPWEALNKNSSLKSAMSILPSNYHFEIPKCIWKILSIKAKTVALQFPEGLLLYSCIISDIFKRFTGVRCILLSDVTYGACCVDDYTAEKVGADLLIHYGHSCLVPITNTTVKSLYVFVEIEFNCDHLVDTIRANFQKSSKLAILGTVQFIRAVREVHDRLKGDGFEHVDIPQVKPLSPGSNLHLILLIIPLTNN